MRRKIITIKEICQMLGKSRSTIWRWQKAGIFPPSVRLGPNSVGLFMDDLEAWLKSRRLA